MVKEKKNCNLKEVELAKHYIDCTNNEENYNDQNLEEFFDNKFCCNVFDEFYKQPLNKEENSTQFPCFMIENPELLDSPPYLPFLPSASFLEEEGFPKTTKKIKYKFHECRCELKHCWLRNSFPTYHPETGAVTSVVNYKCIKNQCSNVRILPTNPNKFPKHLRNHRQIVIWEESFLDCLRNVEGISLVGQQHLGRIVICLNHFSIEAQNFFWKHGFMPPGARIKPKLAGRVVHDGIRVAKEALYEHNMLSPPNPEPMYPSTKMIYKELFDNSDEENTTAASSEMLDNLDEENTTAAISFQSSDKENITCNVAIAAAVLPVLAPTIAAANLTAQINSSVQCSPSTINSSSGNKQNFSQAVKELFESPDKLNSELSISAYYNLIFKLQKLWPKNTMQIIPCSNFRTIRVCSNKVTEDLVKEAKDAIFGFGIWQVNLFRISLFFFSKQNGPFDKKFIKDKENMMVKNFIDFAEEENIPKPARIFTKQVQNLCNASFAAAFVALAVTKEENWKQEKIDVTKLELSYQTICGLKHLF